MNPVAFDPSGVPGTALLEGAEQSGNATTPQWLVSDNLKPGMKEIPGPVLVAMQISAWMDLVTAFRAKELINIQEGAHEVIAADRRVILTRLISLGESARWQWNHAAHVIPMAFTKDDFEAI